LRPLLLLEQYMFGEEKKRVSDYEFFVGLIWLRFFVLKNTGLADGLNGKPGHFYFFPKNQDVFDF
jgi:hypothetical protein